MTSVCLAEYLYDVGVFHQYVENKKRKQKTYGTFALASALALTYAKVHVYFSILVLHSAVQLNYRVE